MLLQSMELIRKNLNVFMSAAIPLSGSEPVILGNIAFSTPDNPATTNVDESAQVYMSLVNIEKKRTSKNLNAVRQSEIRPFANVNPPILINLFVLFSANHKDYTMAIERLGLILLFFQGNRTFSIATPVDATGVFAAPGEDENNIQINVDLMSLTFEQVNHLWGSLGGKQHPFLLFKIRQVKLEAK